MAKYTQKTAALLAKKIYDRMGAEIAAVTQGTDLTQAQLAGFFGVENAQLKTGATRFEAHHFSAMKALRDNGYYTRRDGKRITTFNGISRAQIRDASDEALKALAHSYGLTQIMGWHVINNLRHPETGQSPTVADLRDPKQHLYYCVQLMQKTAGGYLRRGDFGAVLRIWNSGSPTGKTHDPNYVSNASLVAAEYRNLVKNTPVSHEANASDTLTEAQHEPEAAVEALPASVPVTSEPQPVQTVAVSDSTSKKSIWATITGALGLSAVGGYFDKLSEHADQLKNIPHSNGVIKVALIAVACIIGIYLLRQLVNGLFDRWAAYQLNKQQGQSASDPTKQAVVFVQSPAIAVSEEKS